MKSDSTGWLLEPENPSVRHFTLLDILDYAEDHPDVVESKKAIPGSKPVSKILSRQRPGGFWESEAEPYDPKYKATYWQLIILSLLGLDKGDERVRRMVNYIWRFQHEDGGFCSKDEEGARIDYEVVRARMSRRGETPPHFEKWASGKIKESEMSCLTGNVCASLIRMGYAGDPRVRRALEWLTEVQNPDGGWLCPYWKAHLRDTHGCFMGTIAPLDAFADYPERLRTPEMKEAIDHGAEFLLIHRLYKADHHGLEVINRSWLKLGFPCFFYDILRGLDVITRLGYGGDDRIKDALGVILGKQQGDGKWILESTPSGRMQVDLEPKGKPSKWITLKALKVIKRVEQFNSYQL